MSTRRDFIKKGMLASAAASALITTNTSCNTQEPGDDGPRMISTWNFGLAANEAALSVILKDGSALDAVETGVRVPEGDPKVDSVGYGGLPDRDGRVTLDACIMDHNGQCGSVACLEHIMHPVSVARKVMEKTPHVMLVGEGALTFALEQGFQKENLLTEESEKTWKEWLKKGIYKPQINIENHDTIGMLVKDRKGDLSGACTTSGLAYKMHGRVGDSPIIGAALFVDNEIGCATATGHGEYVIKNVGAFLIVELMRQGLSPQEACEKAIARIVSKTKNYSEIQIGFLAMNKKGQTGAYSIQKGFVYALYDGKENKLCEAGSYVK